MDCDLRQWKLEQQHQSEEQQQQHCAKIPRLLVEQPHQESFASALPLFVPEPNTRMSSLSAFSDSSATRFPGMGSLFSSAQWQELELQALIFKYMLAGAPVPTELLQTLIKKSFQQTPPPAAASCYLYPYPQYQHYQPAMLQSGYWGRNAVDPEPGRCRRTDGKKWRCSKEIVLGHKYCERHVHRGRNRSRKLVETATTPAVAVTEGDLKTPIPVAATGNSHSANLIRVSENKIGNGGLLEFQNGNLCGEGGSDGRLLRQFFDDWPRSNEITSGIGRNGGPSRTCLSISTPGEASDFSLKLSTGDGGGREERAHLDWATGWSAHQVSSMGGPLAEALRSATSNDSPTSVLYELNRGTASETSSVST